MMNYQTTAAAPQSPCVALFSYRSVGYKIGLIGFCISFGFFLLGFSSSHWIEDDEFLLAEDSWGLWDADCAFNQCNSELLISRILFVLCLGFYVASLGIAIYENVRKVNPNSYHSRKLELALFLTALVNIVALAVFNFVYLESIGSPEVGWSRNVVTVGVVGLFVVLLILLLSNKKPPGSAGIVLSPAPQQQTVNFQAAAPPVPPSQMYPGPPPPAYPMTNVAYPPAQYPGEQGRPLLPQPYPAPSMPTAPPPYSLPPAYPTYPVNPGAGAPEKLDEKYSKASAPPMG